MAILGGSVTNKFVLGNFELRVGPQELAGKLTSEHSVGIVDKFSLSSQQETVDLNALFPQEIVDTEIVSQTSQLTATIREFSSRNFNLLAGNGFPEYMKVGRLTGYTPISGSETMATLTFVSGKVPQYSNKNNVSTNILLKSASTLGKFSLRNGQWVDNKITLANVINTLNTTQNALVTSSNYTYVIPTNGSTVDSGLACGFAVSSGSPTVNQAVSGSNTLTIQLANTDNAAAYAGTTSTIKDKHIALIIKDPTTSELSSRVVTISAVTNNSGVLTVTYAKKAADAAFTSASVVAYIYRSTSTGSPTMQNVYGTLSAVSPYIPVTSEAFVTLPTSFSGISGDYMGGVIELDGGARASITAYDGPGRKATLSRNLIGAAANKQFTLYTVNRKFSAKLSADAKMTLSITEGGSFTINSADTKKITVTSPRNLGPDYGGYTAKVTFVDNSTSEYVVEDYAPLEDSDSAELSLMAGIATDKPAILSISLAPPKSNDIGSSMLYVVEDDVHNDDIIIPGSQLIIYDTGDLTEAQTVRIEYALDKDASTAARLISVSPPLSFDPNEESSDYRVELVNPVVFGKQKGSQYFTASLVMLDRASGLPVVMDFWKVTLASGINLSVNATDFASTDMVLSILEPTKEDRTTTYSGITEVINNHPMYRIAAIPDAVSI